jgi:hypothetical protein
VKATLHSCECDGSGWIYCSSCAEGDYHDCDEDTCCCADPEYDYRVACRMCGGNGGWACPKCS